MSPVSVEIKIGDDDGTTTTPPHEGGIVGAAMIVVAGEAVPRNVFGGLRLPRTE